MSFSLSIPPGLAPVNDLLGRRVYTGRATSSTRAGGPPPTEIEVEPSDVVELTWEDGTVVVLAGEDLQARDRTRAGGAVSLPQLGGARRGLVSMLVKVVVGWAVPEVAGRTALAIARTLDDHTTGGRTLLTAGPDGRLAPGPDRQVAGGPDRQVAGGTSSADKRALLLVHGTASNTEGAFGKLLASAEWPAVHEHFGSRTFGFDHPTLSASPLDNALAIAGALPEGSALTLLSHSRGGLVADVLAAGCWQPRRDPRPPGARRSEEIAALDAGMDQLRALCRARGLTVERTFRVAAPARGTTLASDRLDKWLNVLLNVVGLVPALKASPVYALVKELLSAVVAERKNPAVMPGIAAMVPGSAFNRWMNALQAGDELTVLAGDAAGATLIEKLRNVLLDAYFPDAHDLVVDTESMIGGAQRDPARPGTVVTWRNQSDSPIHHVVYFENRRLRAELARDLIQAHAQSGTQGATRGSDARLVSAGGALQTPPRAGGRPLVVLLPRAFATRLTREAEEIWPNLPSLARGGLGRLAALDAPVRTDGILAAPYHRWVESMGESVDVHPHAWDWRLAPSTNARLLASALERLLAEDPKRKVHLVTHGEGALVARGLLAWHPDTWARWKERAGRLIMAAPPNHGTWGAARLLLGESALTDLLAGIDVDGGDQEVGAVLRGWPGLLSLLPTPPGAMPADAPLFRVGWWGRFGVDEAALHAAAAERTALAEAVDPDRMVVVVGRGRGTPYDDAQQPGVLAERVTDDGDGVVPWESSRLRGVPALVADAPHAGLFTAPALDRAWHEVLLSGRSGLWGALSERASGWRAVGRTRGARPHPTEADLLTAAVGAPPEPEGHPLRVLVCHGDLALESGVVLVGHPAGPLLRSAEPALDLVMAGALKNRLRIGRYPQELGEAAVILADTPAPPRPGDIPGPRRPVRAALIAGLGPAGALTRTRITAAVEAALLEALAARATLVDAGGQPLSLERIALTPPGCGDRGLPTEDAVAAALEGVVEANRHYRQEGVPPIREVTLVLRYGDQAAAAARAARAWSLNPGTVLARGEAVVTEEWVRVQDGVSGPAERPLNAKALGRWQRLGTRSDDGTRIEYQAPSGGAAGARDPIPVRWDHVTRLAEDLCDRGVLLEARVRALRDYVLPTGLVDLLESGLDVQIGVDRRTAGVPWEAFVSAGVEAGASASAALSILRQLEDSGRVYRRTVTNRAALIVRSPGPVGPEFPALAGVEPEARGVAGALLERDYRVTEVVGDARAIMTAMGAPFEIVHLTGHGMYRAGDPDRSGFVVEGPDGTADYLSRHNLRSLLRNPPALVFLNCCHLGRVDARGDVALAADLAGFLILEAGVQAVVAAGWEVDDVAATAFARSLYDRLLAGEPFRRAVAWARVAARAAAPDASSWAAYQCYGDPEFVLPSAGAGRSSLDSELAAMVERASLVSPLEVVDAVRQVHGRLRLGARRSLVTELREALAVRRASLRPELWTPAADAEMANLEAWIRTNQVAAAEEGRPPGGSSFGTSGSWGSDERATGDTAEITRAELATEIGAAETAPVVRVARPDLRAALAEAERALRTALSAPKRSTTTAVQAAVAAYRALLGARSTDEAVADARELLDWATRIARPTRLPADAAAAPAADRFAAVLGALQEQLPRLIDDPLLCQFGNRAARVDAAGRPWTMSARVKVHEGLRLETHPELSVPAGFTGVVVYHLPPAYRVQARTWGITEGQLQYVALGKPEVWRTDRLHTVGVRLYEGTWESLGYNGEYFDATDHAPILTLELDLSECLAEDEPRATGCRRR